MTHPQGLDYNCRIVWGPWLVTLQKPVTLLDALRKVQQWTMCMYAAFRNQSKKPKTNNNNNKKPHKLTDDKSISCLKHVAVFSSWKKIWIKPPGETPSFQRTLRQCSHFCRKQNPNSSDWRLPGRLVCIMFSYLVMFCVCYVQLNPLRIKF